MLQQFSKVLQTEPLAIVGLKCKLDATVTIFNLHQW